jgi:penicillin-binding protein 2
MIGCTSDPEGTARYLALPALRVPGVDIAGKTGTAQVQRPTGKYDEAWFICFAPAQNPEVALAVAVDGPLGQSFGGGPEASPIASAILKKYFEKKRASVALN